MTGGTIANTSGTVDVYAIYNYSSTLLFPEAETETGMFYHPEYEAGGAISIYTTTVVSDVVYESNASYEAYGTAAENTYCYFRGYIN